MHGNCPMAAHEGHDDDYDLNLAHHAPGCMLITGSRDAAWQAARKIARGCGAGLGWIDCDRIDEDEMADLLRGYIALQPNENELDRILFLREVQTLTRPNQILLERLIAARQPAARRPGLIVSSSTPLYDLVCSGLFDEALFYKLNAVHIAL